MIMDDLVPHEDNFLQITDETDQEYAWFKRYCEIGADRTTAKVAAFMGVPASVTRSAASRHHWNSRVGAYDQARIDAAQTLVADQSQALEAQYAAGMIMMQLGIDAIKIKNPGRMSVKNIAMLLTEGGALVNKGAGLADVVVDVNTTKRVEDHILELFGDD